MKRRGCHLEVTGAGRGLRGWVGLRVRHRTWETRPRFDAESGSTEPNFGLKSRGKFTGAISTCPKRDVPNRPLNFRQTEKRRTNPSASTRTGAGMSEVGSSYEDGSVHEAAGDEDEDEYDEYAESDQGAASIGFPVADDEGIDSDEESPSARVKRMKTIKDEYERRICKLEARNQELEAQNKDLKEKTFAELTKIQKSHAAMISAFSGYAGVQFEPFGSSSASLIQPVRLKQVFNINEALDEGDSLEDVKAPVRFSASGVFPHAIAENKKTHAREYQVEGRRRVSVKFVLCSKLDGRRLTEKVVREDGVLPFKMYLLYADNQDEVQVSDFAKMSFNNLTDPTFESIRTQNMVNGQIVFTVKFNVTSSDTTPKGRSFLLKVTPDVEGLVGNPDMTCISPPFNVRSKVTAEKSR